tara:strand:- start:41974 stop:42498 length:525 start_codon:yes stop_codon:yes gene_type:complete
MRKFLIFNIALLFFGCKAKNNTTELSLSEAVSELEENENQVYAWKLERNDLRLLDEKTFGLVENWGAFMKFQLGLENLVRAKNESEMLLAIEDLIVQETELSNSIYPEVFNHQMIKSRQKLVRTFLLQLKADLLDKSPLTNSRTNFLDSYNQWIEFMNSLSIQLKYQPKDENKS